MNRSLLERVRSLLSTVGLEISYWDEVLTYESHLLNRLPLTVIVGKTLLHNWSDRAVRDHDSLRVFSCPTFIDVKKDILDSKVNKFVFLGYKEDLKGYKL